MGRRSRKRGGVLPPNPASDTAPERPVPRRAGRRPRHEERPKAPWHPFPLVELSALVGIVLLVVGLFNFQHEHGRWMIAAGLALGSLAGLDTVLREHFNGYKSHSTVLGALPAVLVAGVLFFSRAPWGLLVAAMALTFLACFWLARRGFRKRAGVAWR
jgi:hypothetical protein